MRYAIGCHLLAPEDRNVSHAAPEINDAVDLYGQDRKTGSEASFSIDLDDEWLERFSKASNFIDAVPIDPSRLGASAEGEPPLELETLEPAETGRIHKLHRLGKTLDQGREGACVGYSLTHRLNASPVRSTYEDPAALYIYREAQKIDPWPGEDYSGTSVAAGFEVLQRMGYLTDVKATRSIAQMREAIKTTGLVLSVPWYESDYRPGKDLWLRFSGNQVGRHAIFVFGLSRNDVWWLQNSWGPDYAKNGRVRVRQSTLLDLIRRDQHFRAYSAKQLKR